MTRLEQIGNAGDMAGVSRSNQNSRWSEKKRVHGRWIDFGNGGDEVGHHHFRSAEDQIRVGFRVINPLRRRTGGDLYVDSVRLAKDGRGFLHGGQGASRTVHTKRFGRESSAGSRRSETSGIRARRWRRMICLQFVDYLTLA